MQITRAWRLGKRPSVMITQPSVDGKLWYALGCNNYSGRTPVSGGRWAACVGPISSLINDGSRIYNGGGRLRGGVWEGGCAPHQKK